MKNQDPDSSRTLYTYLFTRPSAGKRFDFLAESAAAGRGLDEVIHLFENPVGHHHALAEAEHGHGHDHGEDSETNEATEMHESAEDDDENEENEGADVDTEESEASEEDEEEEDEDEEETSAAEEQPVDSADQYEDEEEEEEEEDEDVGEDFMAEAEDFIRDAEENANQEGEYSDDAEESYEQLQAVVVEAVNHSGHADATAEADNAPDATYSYGMVTTLAAFVLLNANQLHLDDEDEDADANPFIHLEMQETMVDGGVEIQYEAMTHVEEGNEDSHQLAMHPVDEYIDANEAETGTTNTLADNTEAISTLLDIGADQGLEEITNEDLAFEDDMPEIDWRDDLDAPDDAKDEMAAADSGLPKRRRAEDEQDVEDEQGKLKRCLLCLLRGEKKLISSFCRCQAPSTMILSPFPPRLTTRMKPIFPLNCILSQPRLDQPDGARRPFSCNGILTTVSSVTFYSRLSKPLTTTTRTIGHAIAYFTLLTENKTGFQVGV